MKWGSFLIAVSIVCAAPVLAQELKKSPVSQGAVTPDVMNDRLKQLAEDVKAKRQNVDRIAKIDFAWPEDMAEYRALNKNALMLITVVTKDEKELPLRRVYLQTDGRDVILKKITSERRDVPKDSLAYSALGAFREDSFYLAPAGLMMRDGYVVVDFAIKRTGFRIYELPGTPPDFIQADKRPMPAAGVKADVKAVRAMMDREYTGFVQPENLP
jgi:hypothetical protein